jgi:DNA-binding XRE family transcriptional regulator
MEQLGYSQSDLANVVGTEKQGQRNLEQKKKTFT